MTLRALIVGAAAGGGLPQWNCNARNSAAYWREGAGAPSATQSSLAVSSDGANWALINASPDIRAQIMARSQLQPRSDKGLRDTPIVSVLLTNADIDHIGGLLTLRERQAFQLITTAEVAEVLAANPIFNALDPALVTRRVIGLEDPFDLAPGVRASLFSVPGKTPLYLEGETVETEVLGEQTVGVELSDGASSFFYIPGCAAMPAALADRLGGAALVLFDGTLWEDDEMIKQGVGQKTGRRMGHMPMSGEGGSLAAFSDLGVARKVYVHMNNTNPVWRSGPERGRAEAAGWEIGYDGMEITL
ncbi:MAG: pyrroloquinoline quinone biosynthesis protein PqqB [Pseudomonadota bacterium]